ncbi:class I SAM-dependent methyltransferase [Spirosoma areae]
MKPQPTVGGNFNAIAPAYDALAFAVFGRRLQRAQVVWLRKIPVGASVLIVGGGTGWLLEQVLTRCQPRRVVYLEASSRMLSLASRRMIRNGLLGSVDFRVGDALNLSTNEHFDIILTPFVLDLFTEQTLQTQLVPRLLTTLKTNGLWFVTDFVHPQIWWQKAVLWAMIRFFRLTAGSQIRQVADWSKLLAESGLIRQKQQAQVGGMVSSEVWKKGT